MTIFYDFCLKGLIYKMNSYDKINYKLRTQKRIERALMVELINKFHFQVSKDTINYIGMGSLYYTDFIFFHKHCNFDKMYSIEYMNDKDGNKDSNKEKRFNSNKPIDKIILVPKLVSETIDDDDLPLSETNFIWYDYDGNFIPGIIDDLAKTLDKMTQTSILAVSYNSFVPYTFKAGKNVVNTKKCVKGYKDYMIGTAVNENEFVVDKYADTVGDICEKYLQNIVKEKNELLGTNYKLSRISKVTYQDGIKMLTYIWAFLDLTTDPSIECELTKYRMSGDIDLTMENLTLYEKIFLDKHCDKTTIELANDLGLEQATIERYYEYSKYIPEFTEVLV